MGVDVTSAGLGEVVHRSEIDGVPVFWAEAPGPARMSLQFRVGRADETLATAGLTHLVEHLALFGFDDLRHEWGGFVDHLRTVFYASGSSSELVEFAARVSAALTALPLDRFELEKRVLLTESASAGWSGWQRLMGLRFGAEGFGLVDYQELGLRRARPEELAHWTAARFVVESAALWLVGPPPDGLALELPHGNRFPVPEPTPTRDVELPAYVPSGGGSGVAISFLAPRATELTVALALLEERLRHRLRVRRGLSYAVGGSYVPLDGRLAHVMLAADCLDEHAVVVRDELLDEVRRLAETGPDRDELARAIEPRVDTMMNDPLFAVSELDAAAANELMGAPHLSREELRREYEELTSDSISGAVGELLPTAILLAPTGSAAPSGFSTFSAGPDEPLTGQRYKKRGRRVRDLPQPSPVIASSEGVSFLREKPARPITVRFDDVVAVLRLGPGRVTLVGRNGDSIQLDTPNLLKGDALLDAIERAVPEHLFIPFEDESSESVLDRAREDIGYRTMVAKEVGLLPGYLQPGERVLHVADAYWGTRRGLLALTDRRLVHLSRASRYRKRRHFVEVQLHEVTEARRVRLEVYHRGLVVTAAGRKHKLTHFVPSDRAGEFLHALQGDPTLAAPRVDTTLQGRFIAYLWPSLVTLLGAFGLFVGHFVFGVVPMLLGGARVVRTFRRRQAD